MFHFQEKAASKMNAVSALGVSKKTSYASFQTEPFVSQQ